MQIFTHQSVSKFVSDLILIIRTTGAIVVTKEAEYGNVEEDLQPARGLREPGVQRGPLDDPHC